MNKAAERITTAEPGRRTGRGAGSVRNHLVSDENRKVHAAAEAPALRRGQYTILVVDDAHAARYATARMLRAAGYKTLEAANGAQALAHLDAVSGVVLDVHLPDIHGLEVCRLIRANPATANLAVVHLSAVYVTEEDRVRGRRAGADAYLLAPVTGQELAITFDRLLESRLKP